MQIYLETERIVLRQFTPDDVDNLFALDSAPDVMRYITPGIPKSYETTRDVAPPYFLL